MSLRWELGQQYLQMLPMCAWLSDFNFNTLIIFILNENHAAILTDHFELFYDLNIPNVFINLKN